MNDLISLLVDPWQYAFMQRALIVGMVTALVCGVISCWLVLIGWSLMGDAISHAVLPGVVLAYIWGVPFAVGALLFAAIAVTLIGGMRGQRLVKEDAAIGIVFTTLFAFGTVLISITPSQTDLNHILFGNLLGITKTDMWQVIVLGAITVVVVLLKRRDLTLFAFDPTHARSLGLSTRVLSSLLLGALAVTVVVSFQAVGVILAVSMLIVPGATARLLTSSIWRMLWLAPLIAAVCVLVGILLSYAFDTSSGGMIGVVLGVAFGIVYLFGPSSALFTMLRRHHSEEEAEAALREKNEDARLGSTR
ncbi:metal ABC transporter permease [Pseudoclavibacter sp. CFCC 13796]|uniref:metal ABC transporter permease n=1 Tax=Pseudoclavibacter sp. CFCC 13796 TaxID=2615179 RepID=UPI001300E3E1|nr:metal ABC transporter permease [Pseudoclavibacter sp. CFCC 13796]KAB1661171.1 metal ABC transporter permease [Pseudoclavibacter sp. CFCC 13796]